VNSQTAFSGLRNQMSSDSIVKTSTSLHCPEAAALAAKTTFDRRWPGRYCMLLVNGAPGSSNLNHPDVPASHLSA
jgi:hypothetical protein